jgi:uncharacterized MAPEG superfamily protein
MLLDKIFGNFPYKVNPFHALIMIFALAFVPHLMKGMEVRKKVGKAGKPYSIANSRIQTVHALDSSAEGLRIGILNGCHLNGLEAFSYFSVAVLSALLAKVPHSSVEGAASLFIVIRILYTTIYLGPLNGILRTVAWSLGLVVCADLLLIAGSHY